jgi:hypothetical protein
LPIWLDQTTINLFEVVNGYLAMACVRTLFCLAAGVVTSL